MTKRGCLTDIEGLLVGHWTDEANLTGCTVVWCQEPFVASVDVRGGAPGTRETDLLAPGRLVERVDAILLTGGSAFGLAAADGVMRRLGEQGRGHPTGVIPVPIVPTAVIFDLGLGEPVWPGPEAGYAAAVAAEREFATGCVGAGTGASVGKFLGPAAAMKSGLGTACLLGPGSLRVAALAVVNALGNVIDPETGRAIAGARSPEGGLVDFGGVQGVRPLTASLENTVIAVVATNAELDRAGAWRLAQIAQDGLARSIRPAHTQLDGDTVFSLATGEVAADLSLVAAMAVDALAASVVDAVRSATGMGGLPAMMDRSSAARQ